MVIFHSYVGLPEGNQYQAISEFQRYRTPHSFVGESVAMIWTGCVALPARALRRMFGELRGEFGKSRKGGGRTGCLPLTRMSTSRAKQCPSGSLGRPRWRDTCHVESFLLYLGPQLVQLGLWMGAIAINPTSWDMGPLWGPHKLWSYTTYRQVNCCYLHHHMLQWQKKIALNESESPPGSSSNDFWIFKRSVSNQKMVNASWIVLLPTVSRCWCPYPWWNREPTRLGRTRMSLI